MAATPIVSAPAPQNAGARLWDETQSWVMEPIVGQVDMVDLFLLVGIVLVSIYLWTRVMAHFVRE